jgi:hypothetical protein
MPRIFLLAGAAALAIAMPAAAEKGGKSGGHGHHGGKGQAAQAQGHGGHGNSGRGRDAKPGKPDRSSARAESRGGDRGDERRHVRRDDFRPDRIVRVREDDRSDGRRRGRDVRFTDVVRIRDDSPRFPGLGRGCPPGLARKNNGCLPPGQAKKLFAVGDRLQPVWFSGARMPSLYRDLYSDTPFEYYRYDNEGYIYRVDARSNRISGLIPLLGGGFAVGQPLPAGFEVYNVPAQYRDVYYDSDEAYYRYGDNAIYRVDPESNMIESIVALLTGDLAVGQPLPDGYDVYNVPLDYRDDYADNDDYLYRYGDGNIYQVDAKTQIIQAIVEMLV